MKKGFYWQYAVRPGGFERYPLPWETVFPRPAPLAVEIGFGNGDFLLDWARKKPRWNFLGIELSQASMEKILKRLFQSDIDNVRPLHEDARFALRELIPENSLQHVMMNYPDPWPKDRHKDRRLLDGSFVQVLAATLAEEAPYELVTDQEWYARQAYELFEQSPYFRVEPLEENPRRPVTTKYERKWREQGRSSYRVLARKIQSANIERLLEDSVMPHAFVEREVTEQHIAELIGFEYLEGPALFVVKAGFQEVARRRYLLRIIAKDEAYKQVFYITVNRRKEGRWLVKIDPGGQPYRTPAVKLAVWKIGEMLNRS